MTRRSLRPSIRFDVFKRDAFTCAYCGRTPPTVVLEVDHIIPVAEGGTDDPENLTTSCMECNRGKGATQLDQDPPQLPSLVERTEAIREREEQLRAYNEMKAAETARKEEDFSLVYERWFDLAGSDTLPGYAVPWDSTLRRYTELLGKEEVLEAMQIAHDRFRYANSNTVRYFIGILKNKHAAVDGRMVTCIYCGGSLRLDPGDDPTAEWFHAACEPKEPTDG